MPTKLHCGEFEAVHNVFKRVANKYGLPVNLLKGLCWVESRHKESAYNPKDGGSASHGICQVKEKTARHMGFKLIKRDLMRAQYNIEVAGKYLSYQCKRYSNDYMKCVTAYNRGHYRKGVSINYYSKVMTATLRESWNK